MMLAIVSQSIQVVIQYIAVTRRQFVAGNDTLHSCDDLVQFRLIVPPSRQLILEFAQLPLRSHEAVFVATYRKRGGLHAIQVLADTLKQAGAPMFAAIELFAGLIPAIVTIPVVIAILCQPRRQAA